MQLDDGALRRRPSIYGRARTITRDGLDQNNDDIAQNSAASTVFFWFGLSAL